MGALKRWIGTGVFTLVFLINIWNGAIYATSYVSNGGGNWNNAGTWSPAGVPGTNDDVTIQNGDLVNLTANAACKNITLTGMNNCLLCLCGCPVSELRLHTFTLSVSGIFTNNA